MAGPRRPSFLWAWAGGATDSNTQMIQLLVEQTKGPVLALLPSMLQAGTTYYTLLLFNEIYKNLHLLGVPYEVTVSVTDFQGSSSNYTQSFQKPDDPLPVKFIQSVLHSISIQTFL